MNIKHVSIAVLLAATCGVASHLAFANNNDSLADKANDTTTTVKKHVSDTWITTKVKSQLAAQSGLSSTGVQVKTYKGTVYLTGHVDSDAEKALAESAAKQVDGVKNVKNKLAVRNGDAE